MTENTKSFLILQNWGTKQKNLLIKSFIQIHLMVQLVRKKFSRNFLFRSRGKVFLICLVLEIIS